MTSLALNGDGSGYCRADADANDWPTIVAALAGATGEEMFFGGALADVLSLSDIRYADRARLSFELELGRALSRADLARFKHLARGVVLKHEPQIRLLAAELRQRRRFDLAALAAYAWRPGSAIGQWRALYPRPAPPAPVPPPQAGPSGGWRRVLGAPPPSRAVMSCGIFGGARRHV